MSVLPDRTYLVVLNCSWNLFTIENFGVYVVNVSYKSPVNIDCIFRRLDRWLRQALTEPQFSNNYARVDKVKVIVKQIGEDVNCNLTPKAAGALTKTTVKAMKLVFDGVAGRDSRLRQHEDARFVLHPDVRLRL